MLMLSIRGCKNRRSYDFIPKIETFIVNDDFANKSQSDANFKLQLKDEYPVKTFIFGIFLAFFTSSSDCRSRLKNIDNLLIATRGLDYAQYRSQIDS